MQEQFTIPFARSAVFTLAQIKATVEAFDHGDANLFEALDAIHVAIEAHRATNRGDAKPARRRRDAA